MVPEKWKMLPFNDRDYLPQDYKCDDPEKEEMIKYLVPLYSSDRNLADSSKVTPNDPDFWIIDKLLTKEEVKFLTAFKARRVEKLKIEELAKRNNMSVFEAHEIAEEIARKGMLEYDRENETREKQYFISIWVIGSGEYMVWSSDMCKEHPEVASFFNYACLVPTMGAPMLPPGGGGRGMHVVPVEKAIDANNEAVPVERISHWIDKYDKFALGACVCRRQQTMRGEGGPDVEDYWCVGTGDVAEYLVESGKDARYATREEVMRVIERAEKAGYVHQIVNQDGEDKNLFICNCSINTCNALRVSQLYNSPHASASAYRAHVDHEKCVACGKCVEVCPVGAAKLGQKLCKKNGEPVVYPVMETPYDNEWGPQNWNINFRDTVKINCYDTGTSPCKAACPANLSVQGYIQMAAEGRYREALELIKQDNPLPAVCGAICNRRCEDRCTRGTIDKPIAIDEIKKFIAAQELNAEDRFIPECGNEYGHFWGNEYKMAIIGAGPAGLSAAYYLCKRGYTVTVFEKQKELGGMLKYGIPSFRLEKDVIAAEIDVMKAMGVEFKTGVEIGKDLTIDELRGMGYKAFYVAVGLQSGGKLNVPGADSADVISGIDFMRMVNEDESLLKKGKVPEAAQLSGNVVVIGGGNIGADVARTAVRSGADKVLMYALEAYDELPMGEEDRAECESEGISVNGGWGPAEIFSKDGKGCGIRFKKCLSVKNAEGRFDPKYDESETVEVECTKVLFCTGQKADWKDLLKGTKVEFNPNGTAKADPVTLQTAEEDIFVGGDAFTGQKFAIDAIATGRVIADSLHRYVHKENGESRMTLARDLREIIELDRDDILVENYDNTPRQRPHVKFGNPVKTFEDLRLGLQEAQIKAEAKRCLHCGATTVDINRCIGCGLCTTRCEFDAIKLEKDFPACSDRPTLEEGGPATMAYVKERAIRIEKKKQAKVNK